MAFGFLSIPLLGSLVTRFGTSAIAGRLAVSILRTAGYILNRSPVTLGIPFANTPAGRLVTGPPTFLNPLGFPGINSFLAGFAYTDNKDLADGWLSFFGDLVLQDVPLVDTSTEQAIRALQRGDLGAFGEAAADALRNDLGLDTLAAFFRGLTTVEEDFQAVGLPTLSPANWLFGGVIAGVRLLDAAFTSFGQFLGGLAEPPPFIPPGLVEPPGFVTFKRGDETQEEFVERLSKLPTTPAQVRDLSKAFGRFRERIPDLARIIDLLKRTSS